MMEVGSTTKALAKKVGHLDEEGAPVAPKAGFKLAGEGTKTVAVHIVVVAGIERTSRTRRVAKEELAANV